MPSLPPTLASHFTVGHLSALRIVGDECRAHGTRSLHLDAIAARAGVCRSTVRNALRGTRRLDLITLQERRPLGQPSLTNIVRIVSSEWMLWLDRGERFRMDIEERWRVAAASIEQAASA